MPGGGEGERCVVIWMRNDVQRRRTLCSTEEPSHKNPCIRQSCNGHMGRGRACTPAPQLYEHSTRACSPEASCWHRLVSALICFVDLLVSGFKSPLLLLPLPPTITITIIVAIAPGYDKQQKNMSRHWGRPAPGSTPTTVEGSKVVSNDRRNRPLVNPRLRPQL